MKRIKKYTVRIKHGYLINGDKIGWHQLSNGHKSYFNKTKIIMTAHSYRNDPYKIEVFKNKATVIYQLDTSEHTYMTEIEYITTDCMTKYSIRLTKHGVTVAYEDRDQKLMIRYDDGLILRQDFTYNGASYCKVWYPNGILRAEYKHIGGKKVFSNHYDNEGRVRVWTDDERRGRDGAAENDEEDENVTVTLRVTARDQSDDDEVPVPTRRGTGQV